MNDVKAFMEKEKIDGFQLLPTGKNLLETACEFGLLFFPFISLEFSDFPFFCLSGSFEIAFYLADIPMDLTRINFQGETILLSILQPPALISMAIWVEKLALKLIEKGNEMHQIFTHFIFKSLSKVVHYIHVTEGKRVQFLKQPK